MSGPIETIEIDDSLSVSGPAEEEPALVLALQSSAPLAGPVVVPLNHGGEVSIVRGEETRYVEPAPGDATGTLELADGFVSSQHARITRDEHGTWRVEDNQSRNGVFVDGRRITSWKLRDGQVLEMGGCFFVYADAAPPMSSLDEALPPALRTANGELAAHLRGLTDIATSGVSVLLRGGVGTGKELTAQALHKLSRREGPFVAINCGAVPPTLIESELFGTRKGAFSGAHDRVGLIAAANGGTLFLDEVGELPATSQVALLRVLQEREVVPVGATKPEPIDVRFVAATHRNLELQMREEQFREDLYSRLAGFELRLPPLRDRREDMGLMVSTALRSVDRGSVERVSLSRRAARALMLYSWPQNARELHQAIHSATVLADNGRIRVRHLPARLTSPKGALEVSQDDPEVAPSPARAETEQPGFDRTASPEERREAIVTLLQQHDGNVSAVARRLGRHRVQIHRWIARLGINPSEYRATRTTE